MEVKFKTYEEGDYQLVYDFFLELNQKDKVHINWNWARWEWMYFHQDFNISLIHSIGLWMVDGRVVGAAVYDQYFGEAFCGTLHGCEELLPDIIEYAFENLKDENGLGIAVNDEDNPVKLLLSKQGFTKVEQEENVLRISLENQLNYEIPLDYQIQEVTLPKDEYQYKMVLWKGFDHGDDAKEFEQSLTDEGSIDEAAYPHRNPLLSLSITDELGTHLAHCTCWYDSRTDYAYVEPVCSIPQSRGKGFGKAVVCEVLNRCRSLGAKQAYVISNQEFYKKLGFDSESHYSFYWKEIEQN